MILNESGINKVVKYIGEDYCKYAFINGRDLLLGIFNEEDVTKLQQLGITLNNIGGGFHEVILEREMDATSVEGEDEDQGQGQGQGQEGMTPQDVKQLANALIPYLQQAFPSKDEINDVIGNLQAQMIDPDEMIDGLKMQIRRVKKQSRENDEVG